MKRVLELIRVSTQAQAAPDRASLAAQRAANRRTAAIYHLQIVESLEFVDVSGASVLLAPETAQLLRRLASPDLDGVVAREFSRLMRPENFCDYALLQAFADTATILYLPEGPIDFSSKTGRLFGAIRAAFAGCERTEILERIWGAKEAARRRGGFAQGRACLPRGVAYDKAHGWRYTAEAERVRSAFDGLLGGASYTALARELGVSIAGLRAILANPIYAGRRRITQRRDPSPAARRVRAGGRQGDRAKIARDDGDIIDLAVIAEPLITPAQFLRAQAVMAARRAANTRTPVACSRYTYHGLLACSLCAAPLYTHHRRADYYVCRNRKISQSCAAHYMRRDTLDAKLDLLFAERFLDRDFLARILEGARSKARRAEHEHTRQETARSRRLSQLQRRRERILDAFFDGVLSARERDVRLKALDAERAQVDDAPPHSAAILSADELHATLSPFAEFQFLSREQKRQLLQAVFPKITVGNYCVTSLVLLVAPRGEDLSRADVGLNITARRSLSCEISLQDLP